MRDQSMYRFSNREYWQYQETEIKEKRKIQNLSDRDSQITQESPHAGTRTGKATNLRTDSITKAPESRIAPLVLPSANTNSKWLLILLHFDDSAPVAGASSTPDCGGENMFSVAIAVDVCMPDKDSSGYNQVSVVENSDTRFTYTLTHYDDSSCTSSPSTTTTGTITSETCYATDPDLYQIPQSDLDSTAFDKYNLLAQTSMTLQYTESETHPLEMSDDNGLISYGYDNSDCLKNPQVVSLWKSDACFTIPDSVLIYNGLGTYHSAKLSECGIFAGSRIDWNLYTSSDCTGGAADILSVYETHRTDYCTYVSGWWDAEPYPVEIDGEYFKCIGSFEEQCSECEDESYAYLGCPIFQMKGANSDWCTWDQYEYCCGDDCCVSDGGAITGLVIGSVVGIILISILCCLCSSCCPHHDFWCRVLCCKKKEYGLVVPAVAATTTIDSEPDTSVVKLKE